MIKYPLVSSTWNDKELQAIQKVMDSGMFTMGANVSRFENEFAQFLGSRYAVMVNSGSSANLLAIAALFYYKENPLHRGDEVIVPAVSWSTTYHPLYQYGLRLKFVDIDINTLNYDLDILEQAVTSKTRLIVAVNLLGNPNDFERINKIISGNNIHLFEDNCEAMGATYKRKMAGTFGIIGSFSTFYSHHISTMEGGLIVTDNEELFHIMLSLRSHGWTRQLPKFNKVTGEKSSNFFEESFKFILPGYNLRPGEIHGALGIEQLKKLPIFLKKRRENASVFIELFKDHSQILIQQEIGSSSWFAFSMIVKPDAYLTRDRIIDIFTKNGVEFRPIVSGNFTKNPVLKYYDYELFGELKNADWLHRNGLFIGNHHYALDKELKSLRELLAAKY